MRKIIIFYPDSLKIHKIGLIEGATVINADYLAFYILNDDIVKECSRNKTIGYCSDKTPEGVVSGDKSEWIHVNSITRDFTVHNINRKEFEDVITCVSYHLESFYRCDKFVFHSQQHHEHFNNLCDFIKAEKDKNIKRANRFDHLILGFIYLINLLLIVLDKLEFLVKYSTTISHLKNSVLTLRTALNSLATETRIPVRTVNTLTSKLADLLGGYILLYVFVMKQTEIFEFLNMSVEIVIENLRKLLIFLMGSPIGLKLNHAFNTTLGSFFFYHIFLWKTFVVFMRPHLYSIFYLLLIPASFGVSYQAAVVEDLIKFCTVHVYCIYIYATRLYSIQIHAIIAMWRLFIGRKYNPLRKRVDSCEYNHNQIFIGTLAFAILLFLLPTTLLYYIVFVTFRLCLKSLYYALTILRVSLQHLSFYSFCLWIAKSSEVDGSVELTVGPSHRDDVSRLHVKLHALSLWDCAKSTSPRTEFSLPAITWGQGLNKLFAGGLL